MKTYNDFYNKYYKEKIKEIDLFLKSWDSQSVSLLSISEILDLPLEEVNHLINSFQINHINIESFFLLLQYGNNEICKLFRRQIHIGSKEKYTLSDISYIYQIPRTIVNKALELSNLTEITDSNMSELFKYIEMTD